MKFGKLTGVNPNDDLHFLIALVPPELRPVIDWAPGPYSPSPPSGPSPRPYAPSSSRSSSRGGKSGGPPTPASRASCWTAGGTGRHASGNSVTGDGDGAGRGCLSRLPTDHVAEEYIDILRQQDKENNSTEKVNKGGVARWKDVSKMSSQGS